MASKFETAQQRANDGYYPVTWSTTGNVLAIGAERPDGEFDGKRDIAPALKVKAIVIHTIFPGLMEQSNTKTRDWFAANKGRFGKRRKEFTKFKPVPERG